jgi:predicted transcriptional regulator
MIASFADSKFSIEGQLIEVRRDNMVTSIEDLCSQWDWSNNKVKGFLNVLQKDSMITYKRDNKKTSITSQLLRLPG